MIIFVINKRIQLLAYKKKPFSQVNDELKVLYFIKNILFFKIIVKEKNSICEIV